MAFRRHRTKRDKQEYSAPWKVTSRCKNGGVDKYISWLLKAFLKAFIKIQILLHYIENYTIKFWKFTTFTIVQSIYFIYLHNLCHTFRWYIWSSSERTISHLYRVQLNQGWGLIGQPIKHIIKRHQDSYLINIQHQNISITVNFGLSRYPKKTFAWMEVGYCVGAYYSCLRAESIIKNLHFRRPLHWFLFSVAILIRI